ncbi:MAG: hypothetical protein NW223_08225 [Hyphomicrobiaceae bacterium]|nr:hypothetical protein [Hyphomicrobiaceae bacterium]
MPQPVDLAAVLLAALLNPLVIVVAVLMGRQADQWQKIPVAGFAAAVIGSAGVYVLVRVGILGGGTLGRAAAGIFIAQFVLGTLWAGLAYMFLHVRRS